MTEPHIGKEYYDGTGYFEANAAHLIDHDSAFQRYRVDRVLELYRPGPHERVLDLGCGWGTFSFALAPLAREVVGLDFSQKSIALCEAQLAGRQLDNVEFICADAGDSGLPGRSFDTVLAADLFEHLYPEDSVRVIVEARRLLKPGGRLVLWTPCRRHFLEVLKNRNILLKRDISHVDYKSMSRLREMLADAGFVIERAYFAPSHLPGLSVLERSLQRWIPLLRRRIAILATRS